MKYYLCQTPNGPQYARNQIDANKLDRNATVEVVDQDKDALMVRFNDLMARLWAAQKWQEPRVADIGENPASEIPLPHGGQVIVGHEPVQKPKKSMGPGEERMNRTWDQIAIEQFIHNVPDDEAYRLKTLADCIAARLKEIDRG